MEIVCDLDHPVWQAPNCKEDYTDNKGSYCAMGKIITACGISLQHTPRGAYFLSASPFKDWEKGAKMLEIKAFMKASGYPEIEIAKINKTDHELAIRKALQLMQESGMVVFVGSPVFNHENIKETNEQTKEGSAQERALEPASV